MATVRVVPSSQYYSGQGQVIFADRDPATGLPINARPVANAPALEIQVATSQVDHKESMTGQRSVDLVLLTEKNATGTLTIESFTLKNLQDAFYGSISSVTGASVMDEVHADQDSSTGGYILLRHPRVSSVTLTDGTNPIDTDAYYVDEEFGMIQWRPEYLDGSSAPVTGDVEVSYTYADREVLEGLTAVAPPEKYVRFNGINTVDESFVMVDIPRAQFQPLQSLPLITEEIAQVQLSFSILPDPFITSGSKYYKQTTIPAVS